MRIWGIVNVTRDSFSDGGRFLAHDTALAHAHCLIADGANFLDLGAESTHPDSEDVPAAVEIERLAPLIAALRDTGVRISIDTRKPEVMRAAIARGADAINDVNAFRAPGAVEAVVATPARLVVMHSMSGSAGRAGRPEVSPGEIVEHICECFAERLIVLERAGVSRDRIILDPGMGLFLAREPRVSIEVLRQLPALRQFGCELLVSVSRKSFIGALLNPASSPPPLERASGSLAAELWAAAAGADHIRTHDVRALRDAWRVHQTLRGDA